MASVIIANEAKTCVGERVLFVSRQSVREPPTQEKKAPCPLLALILAGGDEVKPIFQSSFFVSLFFVMTGMCLYESQGGETEEQRQSESPKDIEGVAKEQVIEIR